MEKKDKYIFKITVIGNGAVGKTSLIRKYTKGGFKDNYVKTIGAQLSEFYEEIEGNQIKLFFWDIAGQDTFHFLRPAFYKGSKAAILVFSLEESEHGIESFKYIQKWHKEIISFCGQLPVILFGNKVDLVDETNLDDKQVLKLVKKRDLIGYYKTSAKTGQGVIDAFEAIIRDLYSRAK